MSDVQIQNFGFALLASFATMIVEIVIADLVIMPRIEARYQSRGEPLPWAEIKLKGEGLILCGMLLSGVVTLAVLTIVR